MDRKTRLEADRIYLRAPTRRDYAIWSALRETSRAHLTPWEPQWSDLANTKADWRLRSRVWRNNWVDGRAYSFLIFEQSTDHLLGGIALTNVYRGSAQSATLGYWLGHGATRQGFMLEAVETLCAWAFGPLGLARIEASTLEDNTSSRQVLEKAGFQLEGTAKSYLEIAGKRRDHLLYGRVAPRAKTPDT